MNLSLDPLSLALVQTPAHYRGLVVSGAFSKTRQRARRRTRRRWWLGTPGVAVLGASWALLARMAG